MQKKHQDLPITTASIPKNNSKNDIQVKSFKLGASDPNFHCGLDSTPLNPSDSLVTPLEILHVFGHAWASMTKSI